MELQDFPDVPVDLVPASVVRRRGEQRRARQRALVGAAALVVLAGAATTVALSRSTSASLQTADDPSVHACAPGQCPDPSTATPAPDDGAGAGPLSWLSFPTVSQVAQRVPGDWVSSQVKRPDSGSRYDRCDALTPLPTQPRAFVVRQYLTTDGKSLLALSVDDYPDAGAAATALHEAVAAIRQCPTVTTDGPGLGSQQTTTILSSTADSYTARDVQRECQRDHSGCTDAPSLGSVARFGHLVVTASSAQEGGSFTPAALAALADDLGTTALQQYGAAPVLAHVDAAPPATGRTYYAAVLAAGGAAALDAARTAARQLDYPTVLTVPVSCLEGATTQLTGLAQDPHASAAVLLFPDAAGAELFVDGWTVAFEGVAKVTLRCVR